MDRHGIVEWITHSESYFIGSKLSEKKDNGSIHNVQRVS